MSPEGTVGAVCTDSFPEDFDVVVERTISEAVEFLDDRAGETGCIVSASTLPDGDFRALLDDVLARPNPVPFVLFCESDEVDVEEAFSLGVSDLVWRDTPDSDALLARRVHEVTDGCDRVRRSTHSDRRRYRALVENFPNGMVTLFDEDLRYTVVEGGIFDDLDLSRSDIVGRTLDDVFPAENAELLRPHYRRALSGESGRVEVELQDRLFRIFVVPVTDAEGRVTAGMTMSQDVTECRRREAALETLYEISRELLDATTESEVARLLVEATDTAFDRSPSAIYLFDEEAGEFRPAATGPGVPESRSVSLSPREAPFWQVYSEREMRTVDAGADASVIDDGTGFGSELQVPIGDHGVLVVAVPVSNSGDRLRNEFAQMLAATAAAAFDRVTHTRTIREREKQLQRRNARLERVRVVTDCLRRINRSIVEAETRHGIERNVCETLCEADAVSAAAVCERTPIHEELVPRTWSGDDRGYFESVQLTVANDSTDPEPSVATAESGTVTRVATVGNGSVDGDGDGDWRLEALSRDFHSVLSVPLSYEEASFGVLTVYFDRPDVVDDLVESVAAELGELVATSIAATRRTTSLLSDQERTFEFELTDPGCVLLRFASQSGCSLSFEGTIPRSEGDAQVFVTADEGDVDSLLETIADSRVVSDVDRVKHQDGEVLLRLRFREPFIGTRLAKYGLSLEDVTAGEHGARAVVTCPPNVTGSYVTEIVRAIYPGASLVAKSSSEKLVPAASARRGIHDDLTDRQQEAIRTAYRSGFFEWPRENSGEEIAEMMDLSPSSFHRHLRLGLEKILAGVVDDPATDEDTTGPTGSE